MPEPIITPVRVVVGLRVPASVVERLARRAHGKHNEIVDLALLLRLHPLIRIETAVGAVTARNLHRDFARNIGDVEVVDLTRTAFARKQPLPRRFDAAAERRQDPQSGYDHASHSWPSARPTRPGPVASSRAGRDGTALATTCSRAIGDRKASCTRTALPAIARTNATMLQTF
jgi:hypothetical protein